MRIEAVLPMPGMVVTADPTPKLVRHLSQDKRKTYWTCKCGRSHKVPGRPSPATYRKKGKLYYSKDKNSLPPLVCPMCGDEMAQ